MRILLDESLPHDLAALILDLAKLPIAVVVLVARKNRLQDLAPLLPELAVVLNHLVPRTLRTVGV